MPGKSVVLVTGANGYIAGQTILSLLEAGYAVRGIVRSKTSAEPLIEALVDKGSDLEIVEVPDIVSPGAFDSVVQGVDAIAHLASPIGFHFQDLEGTLGIAVGGTVSVLESAMKSPSVKSVTVLSSIAAIASQGPKEGPFTEDDWNTAGLELAKKLGDTAPGPLIYAASKTAAELAFWQFRDERSPKFSMSAVNPSFVMGPHVGLKSPSQISPTTAFIWKVLSGEQVPKPITENPAYVDVRDVASAVVYCVNHPDLSDRQRYLLSRGVVTPQACADILRDHYQSKRQISTGEPGQGYRADFGYSPSRSFDGSKIVRATGKEYYKVEQTLIDTAISLEKFI